MTDLVPRRPLASRDVTIGNVRLIVRNDLTAPLLLTRDTAPVAGALRLGPHQYLFVSAEGAPQRADAADAGDPALAHDMTSAFAFIDILGPDLPARLGIASFAPGTGGATRLADLTAFVTCGDAGLRLIVARSYAAYVWDWLTERLAVTV